MPRGRSWVRPVVAGLALVVFAGGVTAAPASGSPNRSAGTARRLRELQGELAQLTVPIAMGTSLWLGMEATVKPAQARIRHDQRELRGGHGSAAVRADLRTEQRLVAPLLPWWFWVKGLLHRSWHLVKLTLLRLRGVVAGTLGRRPGAGGHDGLAAWRRVFHRPAPRRAGSRLDACPVGGPYISVDTFGAPRPGGRFHEGVDLQTARGMPIAAALPGVARRVPNSLGGNAVIVDSAGGTYTYYAHLSAYGASGPVAAGEVIGYAGASGDARGLIPHLHFELHPSGGAAVDAFHDLQAVC